MGDILGDGSCQPGASSQQDGAPSGALLATPPAPSLSNLSSGYPSPSLFFPRIRPTKKSLYGR
jgi:hypothetical protein